MAFFVGLAIAGGLSLLVGIITMFKGYQSKDRGEVGWGSAKASLPVPVLLIGAGLFAIGYAGVQINGQSDTGSSAENVSTPAPSPSTLSGTTGPTTAAGSPSFAFTSPEPNAQLPGKRVVVSGTVGDIDSDTLWFMTRADSDQGQAYYLSSSQPTDLGANGEWTVQLGPFGERPSSVVHSFTIVAVEANSSCVSALLDDPRPYWVILPTGCSELDRLEILLNRV